jgi:cytochrome c5
MAVNSAPCGFQARGPADIIARYTRLSAITGPSARTGTHVRNHDLVFLKHFSQIIGVLVAITIALILAGRYFNGLKPVTRNRAADAATVARIEPAGAVFAGSTGAAAQAAAAQAALDAAKGQVAYDGTLDGAVIYGQLCTGCHTAGVAMAPKLEKSAWGARIAQGKDTLHQHAIAGYKGPDGGVMPARGGNPSLSDEQVIATVDWMLTQLK